MLPAPKGGSRVVDPCWPVTGRPRASMLPAPKGGSRAGVQFTDEQKNQMLQCCPPRRAGVGRAYGARSVREAKRFNAARPEGRESDANAKSAAALAKMLQCCPPRRAGVGHGAAPSHAAASALQCCPPRRAGVGDPYDGPGNSCWPLQCCPPRRAGVGWQRGGGRWIVTHSFNAARPEGRESGDHTVSDDAKTIALQCCPPRRAGVGVERRAVGVQLHAASMLPAPKGGSREVGRELGTRWDSLLQCCPPRRAGVGPTSVGLIGSQRRRFNAARPEGRESGHGPTSMSCPRGTRFNAARPEGRESGPPVARRGGGERLASMLPAPKGGSRVVAVRLVEAGGLASMLPAPKGGSRAVTANGGPPSRLLQCCPPRRAGVGIRYAVPAICAI